MAQRRHHYERAFEAFLRARRIPYVAVDEAKKALLPHGSPRPAADGPAPASPSLKSFDFVIYGESGSNLLIDIKGRRVGSARHDRLFASTRLESWVTLEDVSSLLAWERLFGLGFSAAFVFVYWCEAQPPDALFQEVFEHHGLWYALRTVGVAEYQQAMKTRSQSWGTVDLPRAAFERLSQPFAPPCGTKTASGMWAGLGGPGNGLQPDPGPDVPALIPL